MGNFWDNLVQNLRALKSVFIVEPPPPPIGYFAHLQSKYKELSYLSWENRSRDDAKNSIIRPTVPLDSPELRAYENIQEKTYDPFDIDYNAIRNSSIFQKLGGLSQLAPTFSTWFKTRLTHTSHVVEVTTTLCAHMGLSKASTSLARACAGAHDIGHAAFSHEAEQVFNKKLERHNHYWDHDYFGLKILTKFAHGGVTFSGFPITLATLEGVVKRFKRYLPDEDFESGKVLQNHFNRKRSELGSDIEVLNKFSTELKLDKWSHAEGQIASIADWIAYTVSDIRDIMMTKIETETPIEAKRFFDQLCEHFPPAKEVWGKIRDNYVTYMKNGGKESNIKKNYKVRMEGFLAQFSTELQHVLVTDVLENSLLNLRREQKRGNLATSDNVRELDNLLITISPKMEKQLNDLKGFYIKEVYPHIFDNYADIDRIMERFYDMIHSTFETGRMLNKCIKDDCCNELQDYIKKISEKGGPYENRPEIRADLNVLIGDFRRIDQGVLASKKNETLHARADNLVTYDKQKLAKKYLDKHFIGIDSSWLDKYTSIEKIEGNSEEREKRKNLVVMEAITCNFTDTDVFYYLKRLDRKFYEQTIEGRKDGLYPVHVRPDAAPNYFVFIDEIVAAQITAKNYNPPHGKEPSFAGI